MTMAANANVPTVTTKSGKSKKRFFTLSEANRALTYVSRVADDISATYAKLMDCRRKLEQSSPAETREHLEADYEVTMDRLSTYIDELQALGVELKDFEQVLVDFPCMHEDREVYLCWHRGEDKITAWHEVDAGYSGRRDVSALSAAARA